MLGAGFPENIGGTTAEVVGWAQDLLQLIGVLLASGSVRATAGVRASEIVSSSAAATSVAFVGVGQVASPQFPHSGHPLVPLVRTVERRAVPSSSSRSCFTQAWFPPAVWDYALAFRRTVVVARPRPRKFVLLATAPAVLVLSAGVGASDTSPVRVRHQGGCPPVPDHRVMSVRSTVVRHEASALCGSGARSRPWPHP
jgi:hypothetical protein